MRKDTGMHLVDELSCYGSDAFDYVSVIDLGSCLNFDLRWKWGGKENPTQYVTQVFAA